MNDYISYSCSFLSFLFSHINEEEIKQIILFGSAARGKIHPESDIDICFVKENIDPLKTKRLLRELLWQAGFTWEREPDIHIYDSKVYRDWLARGDPFISEIEKGKTLYAR